jgi:phage tail protein X
MKANLNRLTILALLLAVLILSASVVQGAPPVQAGGKVHVVQWGDTLYSLARRYGTTVAAIVQANNLANPNWIYTGQRLIAGLPFLQPRPAPRPIIPCKKAIPCIPLPTAMGRPSAPL